MRLNPYLLVLVASCGRIGFAPSGELDAGGDAALDAPRVRPVDELSCTSPVSLSPSVEDIDQIFWFTDASGDWLVSNHHVNNANHQFRLFELTSDGAGIQVAPRGVMLQTMDAFAEIVRTGSEHLVIWNDFTMAGMLTRRFADGVLATAGSEEPNLHSSQQPAAVDASGAIAVVALALDGSVTAMPVAADGSFTTTATVQLAPAAEQPRFPTVTGLASGFIVAWSTNADDCRMARLDRNLQIVAGPITLTLAHDCVVPRAAGIDTDRLLLVASTYTTNQTSYAMFDYALTQIGTTTTMNSALEPRLIADGDRTWVSWGSAVGDQMVGWIDRSGTLTTMPSPGKLLRAVPYAQTPAMVDGVPVLVWSSTDTALAAIRLCR